MCPQKIYIYFLRMPQSLHGVQKYVCKMKVETDVGLACFEEDESYARGSTILDRSNQRSQMKSVSLSLSLLNNMVICNLQKPIPSDNIYFTKT